MSRPPKIDRKSLKNPDQFVVKGRHFIDELADHRSTFLTVLGVLAVIGLGYYGYSIWSDHHDSKAWQAYITADRLPVDKKFPELKGVYSKYNLSRPTFFAAVAVADHAYDDAKKEVAKPNGDATKSSAESVEWYTNALKFSGLGPNEKQLLLINRGGANEIAKKYDEALTDYRSATDITGYGKGLAMLGTARVYELKNEIPKAVEMYNKVSSDLADTEFAKTAKNLLRRLQSPLFKEQNS